jgi:hypothetical protein
LADELSCEGVNVLISEPYFAGLYAHRIVVIGKFCLFLGVGFVFSFSYSVGHTRYLCISDSFKFFRVFL